MGGSDERSGHFLRPEVRRKQTSTPHVLVAEDGPDLQWRLARTLTIDGCRVVGTSSAEGAVALLEQCSVDVALISERIWNSVSSDFVTERLRRLCSGLPIVLIASTNRKPSQAAVSHTAELESANSPIVLRPPIRPENVRTALDCALNRSVRGAELLTSTPTG